MNFIEKTIVIFMGIPGAGKSTFYEKHFKRKGFVRVNLDTLVTRTKEKALINKLFKEGKSFVIDNTNCSKSNRERYIPEAKEQGYKVIGYYFEPDLEASLERNKRRRGKRRVPESQIIIYYYTLIQCKPSYDEKFDVIHTVINDNRDMLVVEYKE